MLGKLIIISIYVYVCVPQSNGGKTEYLEKVGTRSWEMPGTFNQTDSLINETVKYYGIDLEYNTIKVDVNTLRVKCECK
jgi:hypothetical protein